jgi:hypothetical protein
VIRLDEVNHSTSSSTPPSAHNSTATATMPVVKGGVWTNIEDEILKASVVGSSILSSISSLMFVN